MEFLRSNTIGTAAMLLERRLMIALSLLVIIILITVSASISSATDDELSNSPMETKVKTAPANIMFLLDNSGSMDWELLCPEPDGIFHGACYIFNISDNYYTNSGRLMTGTKLLEWKSQWSGYNRIYYNVKSTYQPWPRWEKMAHTQAADGTLVGSGGTPPPHLADLKQARSNPIKRSPTFNMFDVFYPNVPVSNHTIVDDEDGSPAFDTTGNWQESGLTPEWNNHSKYTGDDGGTATFTPDIPTTGQYKLYAYWNCYSGRDQHALITVDSNGDGSIDSSARMNQRSSSNNTPESGVCGEWLPLFGGASFLFNAGRHGYVRITHDSSSNGSTVADAIAFVKTGSSVSSTMDIHYAHYYAVHDADNDGIADPGEVYLVNFVWNDTDSDNIVEDGEVSRNYYLVTFDNNTNNHEKVQYLSQVNYDPSNQGGDDIPDDIQPQTHNEDGTTTFLTDIEDLQNFANWASFYRRRELTAKAAVSRTINGLEWVNVGYYTLHSSGGVRQTVLPIQVSATNEVIVDNRDSGFTHSNRWKESGVSPKYKGSTIYTTRTDKWGKWVPNIPADGDYEVFGWWNCYYNRDQKAKFEIHHSSGTTIKYMNQRASANNTITTKDTCDNSSGSGCCGYWVSMGTYHFNKGNSGYVKVIRTGSSTGSSTAADAVKFVGGGSVVRDDTNTLLDKLYSIDSAGGTPLRTSLLNIGYYFDQDDGRDGNLGASPYLSEANGGGCQQSYTVAMTDGYWNGSNPSVGNQDHGKGAPFADNFSNTLADVAWKFYDTDLADSLPNDMSTNNYDKSKTQHMVTFSVSFGLNGSIDINDINGDGTKDDPGYADDPYFLNPLTPKPTWPDPTSSCSACPKKIDDLWHASVNGRGRYFQANDPDSLVQSLKELFKDIGARAASGASVSVNGDELSTGLVLYQSSYDSGSWIGNVTAYPIDPISGEVKKDEDDIKWQAKEKLQDLNWDTDRRIIASTFNNNAVEFRYANLTQVQKDCLDNDSSVVNYIRGKEITGFRSRNRKLGDIVHSAPLLVDSTIYVGSNDGMLHAFDAETGVERFAFIPFHAFTYLHDLTMPTYNHRFFVDATPYAKDLRFLNSDGTFDQKKTVLVGALKKGGRGIYALDITNVDNIDENTTETSLKPIVMWEYPPVPSTISFDYAGDQTADGIDNDNDGAIDEADENYSDGLDNDGDGVTDEEGERWIDFGDDDMGYSFSNPVIVRSYRTTNETMDVDDHPWIVIFGNGYGSKNGHAVLYVVDALTGALIKKIDTGVGSNNGLSSPTVVDIDNDDRADYVYAGDLRGNIWKFDLTAADTDKWKVAYGTATNPQPLFSAPDQPITTAPDVMYHCEKDGYLVVFGTGKFLGENDRDDLSQQSIFGIWDYANMIDATSDGIDNNHNGTVDEPGEKKLNPDAYLGTWNRTANSVSHLSDVKLLEQTQIDWRVYGTYHLRTLSDNKPQWYVDSNGIPKSDASYASDNVDNDHDGETDETDENIGHVGWFFDLPYTIDASADGEDNDNDGTIDESGETKLAGERIIKDAMIRDGRLIINSFIPEESPCTGGGFSIVHEMDACTGGRLDTAVFDINNDGVIDDSDLIDVVIDGETVKLAPTGREFKGILHSPVIVGDPDKKRNREMKIFSSSAGTTEVIWERKEETGFYYWIEH